MAQYDPPPPFDWSRLPFLVACALVCWVVAVAIGLGVGKAVGWW